MSEPYVPARPGEPALVDPDGRVFVVPGEWHGQIAEVAYFSKAEVDATLEAMPRIAELNRRKREEWKIERAAAKQKKWERNQQWTAEHDV